MEIQAVLRILRLTVTDRTVFVLLEPLKVLFESIQWVEFSRFDSVGKLCPKPKSSALDSTLEVSVTNKEKYKQKYGNKRPDGKTLNKNCWYMDCGYCLKYKTRCFKCNTND